MYLEFRRFDQIFEFFSSLLIVGRSVRQRQKRTNSVTVCRQHLLDCLKRVLWTVGDLRNQGQVNLSTRNSKDPG